MGGGQASAVAACRLSCCGKGAYLLRGTWNLPRLGDWTHVSCTGRWILNHCATREVPEHSFTSVWDGCNCVVVWTFLALVFFGTGMKTDLFQSRGHCWVFQICWHIECNTFTTSSFRIWNSSTGIPSSPLALFIVMLPKAHLTLHSRMSGSRWMITQSWLSGS